MEYRLQLDPSMFSPVEKLLFEGNGVRINAFSYSTGVEAVRVSIGKGEFVWLPFLAQQIWSWKVDGIEQKFEGFVSEPSYDAKDFGENYGAFLIHCGAAAMGNPAADDEHPQHGELPLARYRSAWLEISDGEFPIALCGKYDHFVPFSALYSFSPRLRLSEDGKAVVAENRLQNLQNTPLSYMYLNHINFSIHGVKRLEYDVDEFSKERVVVLDDVVPGVQDDPERFLEVTPQVVYDPELVAIIKNQPAGNRKVVLNKAHKEDGDFFWNAIETSGLDHTVVWLTQTPDRRACGFSLPATAGPRGANEEERHGNIKSLPPAEFVDLKFAFGTDCSEEKINTVIRMLEEKYD